MGSAEILSLEATLWSDYVRHHLVVREVFVALADYNWVAVGYEPVTLTRLRSTCLFAQAVRGSIVVSSSSHDLPSPDYRPLIVFSVQILLIQKVRDHFRGRRQNLLVPSCED